MEGLRWLTNPCNQSTTITAITMFRNIRIPAICSAFILLFLVPAMGGASGNSPKNITISLPAETVLHSLKNVLPLTLSPQSNHMQGQIILESIDKLNIHDNTLSLQGVVSGKDLAMTTKIGGRDIRLKLGAMTLPLACDLLTRYDYEQKTLFITPHFLDHEGQKNKAAASLTPLLAALAKKEYPVTMDSLQQLNVKIGDKNIPLSMDPVKIIGRDNTFILKLQPKVTPTK